MVEIPKFKLRRRHEEDTPSNNFVKLPLMEQRQRAMDSYLDAGEVQKGNNGDIVSVSPAAFPIYMHRATQGFGNIGDKYPFKIRNIKALTDIFALHLLCADRAKEAIERGFRRFGSEALMRSTFRFLNAIQMQALPRSQTSRDTDIPADLATEERMFKLINPNAFVQQQIAKQQTNVLPPPTPKQMIQVPVEANKQS